MQNKICLLIFFAEAQFIVMSVANKDDAKQNMLTHIYKIQSIYRACTEYVQSIYREDSIKTLKKRHLRLSLCNVGFLKYCLFDNQ